MPSKRKTITSESQALYVGPSPATGYHFYRYSGGEKIKSNDLSDNSLIEQLFRVQSVSYAANYNKVPVRQYGQIDAIDMVSLTTPTVDLEFTYLLNGFSNERSLGFSVNQDHHATSGILTVEEEKNFFLKIVEKGEDARDYIDFQNENVITLGFGNMVIISYESSAAVGDFASVSVGFEGQNMLLNNGVSGDAIPALDSHGNQLNDIYYKLPTASGNPGTGELGISAFYHGDITMSIRQSETGFLNREIFQNNYNAPGINLNNACIQGYNLKFDIDREIIDCLGNRFSKTRKSVGAIEANLSVDVIVSDLTTGNLSDLLNCKDEYDVSIRLHQPYCCCNSLNGYSNPTGRPVLAQYFLKSMNVDSIEITSNIGNNKTATINFLGSVGGTNPLSSRGLYMYDPYFGVFSTGVFTIPESQILCAFINDSGFLDVVGSGGYDPFDCYDVSEDTDSVILDLHSGWATIWVTLENYVGLQGVDDIELYEEGLFAHAANNGGSGFNGAYGVYANFSGGIGDDNFEQYNTGEIISGTSQFFGSIPLSGGNGWSGNWAIYDNL